MPAEFKKLTDQRWVNLFEITNDEEGKPKKWWMTSRQHEPQGKSDNPDAVVICAYNGIGKDLKTVVLKQWRPAIEGYEYEFPAGLIDEGETAETSAKRELWEETGLTMTRVERVSPNIFSSSGMTDESVVVVFCGFEGEISAEHQEADENIVAEIFDAERLENLFNQRGEFEGAKISAKAWLMMDKLLMIAKM